MPLWGIKIPIQLPMPNVPVDLKKRQNLQIGKLCPCAKRSPFWLQLMYIQSYRTAMFWTAQFKPLETDSEMVAWGRTGLPRNFTSTTTRPGSVLPSAREWELGLWTIGGKCCGQMSSFKVYDCKSQVFNRYFINLIRKCHLFWIRKFWLFGLNITFHILGHIP